LAGRLEAFDKVGDEERHYRDDDFGRGRHRHVRVAATCGNESGKLSHTDKDTEVMNQLADLKSMLSSCRQDVLQQRQETEELKLTLKNSLMQRQIPSYSELTSSGGRVHFTRPRYIRMVGVGVRLGLRLVGRDRPLRCKSNVQQELNSTQKGSLGLKTRASYVGRGDIARENALERVRKARVVPRLMEYGLPVIQKQRQTAKVITNGSNGVEVYFTVNLNGKKIYGLLDTGCETSAIGRRLILNELLRSTALKLFAANGTAIPLLGEVDLNFNIGGQKVSTVVVISGVVEDLILGIDWLGRHDCRWEFGRNLIEVDGKGGKVG
jgi:hypothetical protein